MKYTIKGRLPGLNEYITALNSNRYEGNAMKQQAEKDITRQLIPKVKITKPVFIKYKWYEQSRRRDLDNVAFAKKFINDAMVKCGVLQNDGWKNIVGFSDEFYIDKENPRTEIEIMEVE